jgi:hypothetical protein
VTDAHADTPTRRHADTCLTAKTPAPTPPTTPPTPDDTSSRQCSGRPPPPPARGGSLKPLTRPLYSPLPAMLLLLRNIRRGVSTQHRGLRARANLDRCARPTDVAPLASAPPWAPSPTRWCASATTTASGSELHPPSPPSAPSSPDPCQGMRTEERTVCNADPHPNFATVMVAASKSAAARAACRRGGESKGTRLRVRGSTSRQLVPNLSTAPVHFRHESGSLGSPSDAYVDPCPPQKRQTQPRLPAVQARPDLRECALVPTQARWARRSAAGVLTGEGAVPAATRCEPGGRWLP